MPIISDYNILGSFLPTVYISKIVLNENRVDLELMLIDTANTDLNEGVFSLINDEILRDCVKIRIVESTDSSRTQKLFSGILGEYMPLGSEGYTLNYITSDNSKQININNLLDNLKFESDEEGNKKYYYSTFFETNTIDLNHLSYVVFCEIDQNALQQNLGFSINELELSIPKKISGEVVIDEAALVSNSYVYYLGNSIWLGEVIYLNNQYQTLETPARILNRVQIPNNKIQDFRLRNLIRQNSASEQLILSSSQFIERQININPNVNIPLSQPRIFEEPIKYLNSDGTISISLFIDLQETIRQKCLFPSLLTNKALNETQNSIISNISLYRRQINKIYSNDGRIIVEPLKEKYPTVISQNFSSNKRQSIGRYLHFLLEDTEIKNVTNGIYQYGVEIKFEDPTVGIVLTEFRKALNSNKLLLEYFNICESFTDRKTFNFKPELTQYLERYQIDIISIINDYIDVYTNFYVLPTNKADDMRRSLESNTDPITGSLDGIYLFIKMFEDLIADISKLLSITKSSNQITDFDISDIATKSNIQILKYFPNLLHDSGEVTKLELKYFNVNSAEISQTEFDRRINKLIQPQNNQELYVNPKSIIIYKDEYDFDLIENASSSSANWIRSSIYDGTERTSLVNVTRLLQDYKYRLIKNKIINILKQQDFQSNLEILEISGSSQARINNEVFTTSLDLPRELANIQQNNIFNDYSVLLYKNNIESDAYEKNNTKIKIGNQYDEFSLENVIQPRTTLDTTAVQNNPVLLSVREIELNNEETRFKYLMLVKVQYLSTNSNNVLEWFDLTKQVLQNSSLNNSLEVVCRLMPYDYQQIGVENTNNFFYNNYFILNSLSITEAGGVAGTLNANQTTLSRAEAGGVAGTLNTNQTRLSRTEAGGVAGMLNANQTRLSRTEAGGVGGMLNANQTRLSRTEAGGVGGMLNIDE